MTTPTSLDQAFSEQNSDKKFGTFAGVFVPTLLTILGAIMYLRLGWVVGNAGLLGAIAIILLANLITFTTGLSVSSIATNIRVGAGGAFSIISQSLGLEVGGSISLPLYLAQSVSTTLYIFAFTEGCERIYYTWQPNAAPGDFPFAIVALVSLVVVFIIAYISAQLALRIQFVILAIVGFSLFSIVLGSFATAQQPGLVLTPILLGDYSEGDFWSVFAVFFPAVTGIMAGISLSGNLQNPRRSIPVGTMSAISLALGIYLFLTYWLAHVATPAELVSNTTIMVDKSYWGWAVLAGLLGATFSSALGSLLAAPRVMQALGQHGVLPFGKFFAEETIDGEPRNAMKTTGLVALAATIFGLLTGGLNAIAPLITMFFLITYFMLNAVVLIEQSLSMVSFRPTFAIPRIVPLIGLLGCLVVMFLINPIFSLVAIVATLIVYGYLGRRQLNAPWEDVRSGLFMSLARLATRGLRDLPPAPERTWSPNILAPVQSTKSLLGSYRFLRAIAKPQGSVQALGIYKPNDYEQVAGLQSLARAFVDDGISSRATLLEAESFLEGTHTALQVLSSVFFRPNILFLEMSMLKQTRLDDWAELMAQATTYRIAVVLFVHNKVVELGREQRINVWMREQSPEWGLALRLTNLDLSLLLAYQLTRNWNGRINLCMAVSGDTMKQEAEQFLNRLIDLARLPSSTQISIFDAPFWEALSDAPTADLSIFGLQTQPDLDFVDKMSNWFASKFFHGRL